MAKSWIDRLHERTPAELLEMIHRQEVEIAISNRDLETMKRVLAEKRHTEHTEPTTKVSHCPVTGEECLMCHDLDVCQCHGEEIEWR